VTTTATQRSHQSLERNLASSGSYARGDEPRSVPDPDKRLHEEAARRQRAYNERQEAVAMARGKARATSVFPDVGHPNEWEALIPVWGAGREALADAHDGDVLGAIGNGAMAVTDIVPAKAVGGAVLKGAVKIGGSHVWRTKPWDKAQGVRQWMGEVGYLKPGEHGHHWAIPKGGWGKSVPDWVKNQPWNIVGLDAVTHGRIHGRYTVDGVKLPRYGRAERLLRGTPDWSKAAMVATPAGVARSAEASGRRR
jgi:hypothetical protein